MGIEVAAGIMGAGQLLNTGFGIYNQSRANREAKRRQGMVEGYVRPTLGQGPTQGQTDLRDFLGSIQGPVPTAQGFNIGQDALLQMLRANPEGRTANILQGIAETGDPFDTSNVFSTLQRLDQRNRAEALADVRGTAGGLGERFGSANQGAQLDAVRQLLDTEAARNAQIAMGAHEAAQARRLQATGQLTDRDRLQAGIAESISRLGLDKMGLDENRLALILQGLLGQGGLEQGSRQQDLGALSLLLGLPIGQAYNPAGDVQGIGQLLMFMNMMKNAPKPAAGGTA